MYIQTDCVLCTFRPHTQIELLDVVVYLTPEGAFLNGRKMVLPGSVGSLAISRIGQYLQVTGLDGRCSQNELQIG